MKIKYPIPFDTHYVTVAAVAQAKTFNPRNNFGAVKPTTLVSFNSAQAESSAVTRTESAPAPPEPEPALTVRPADTTGGTVLLDLTSATEIEYRDHFRTTELRTAFYTTVDAWGNAVGYDLNTYSYAARAVFASYTPIGGPTQSNYACIARFGISGQAPRPREFHISAIDQTDTRWATGLTSGPMLRGVFALPVTLTKYTSKIELGYSDRWSYLRRPGLTLRPADTAAGTSSFNLNDNILSSAGYSVFLRTTFDATVDDWTYEVGHSYSVYSADAVVVRAVFASYTPTGGPTQSNYMCFARFKLLAPTAPNGYQIKISVIDQTNIDWQSGQVSSDSGSALTGTFALPVTLTEYNPTTTLGTW